MTDINRSYRERERGEHAKRVMEDPLVVEAFAVMEKTLIQAWQQSDADDEKGRYNAYLMQRLLKEFRHQFEIVLATGKAAARELMSSETTGA